MKLLRLTAFAAVVSLAACTSSPTESARTDAVNASFDGGNTLGSGAESTSEGGGGLGSGNYTADAGTTPADTTGRGPGMLGSGN